MENISIKQLGQARKVTIDNDNTIIVEGAGSNEAISGRIKQIQNELETTTSDYDREKLQERLAKLTGGVAQINVGAASEAEMKERKARIEDGADPIATLQDLETHVDTVIGRYQTAHASILVQAANFQNRLI